MAQRRRRNKKWVSWIIILVLLVVAIIVGYLVWDSYFNNDKEQNESESSTEENDTSAIEEKTEEKDDVIKNKDEEEKKIIPYDGEDPNKSEELTGAITFSGVSGADLMIRVNIDQYLSDGSCSLSLVKDGREEYGKTARIINSAATSTCEGFNVPLSEINQGDYTIIIKLDAGEKSGTIKGGVSV